MSSSTPETQRLFFALWPSAELQARIDAAAKKLIGKRTKRVPAANLHITLAFLGSTTCEHRACYEQAATSVRAAPFTLTLQRLGHWPVPRILWLGPAAEPEPLLALVRSLNAALTSCGYAPEARPFKAHITLARKVDRPLPEQAIAPIEWVVDRFALVESVTLPEGSQYRVLKQWPLGV